MNVLLQTLCSMRLPFLRTSGLGGRGLPATGTRSAHRAAGFGLALMLVFPVLTGCTSHAVESDTARLVDAPFVGPWRADADVDMSYGVLLLDQSMRGGDMEGIMRAVAVLADTSPIASPFIDAATFFLYNKTPGKSREIINRVLPRFNDDMNLHLLLAESWLEEGESAKALDVLEAFAKHHPDSVQARQELAILLTKAGKHQMADAEFSSLPEDSLSSYMRFVHAKSLNALGRDNAAIATLRKAVRTSPDFVEAWFDLALLLQRNKKFTEALKILEDLDSLDGEGAHITQQKILCLLDMGKKDKALAQARANADNPSVLFSTVLALSERKLYKDAEKLLTFMQSLPDVAQDTYFFLAGIVHESRRNLEETLRLLEKIKPDNRFYERGLRFRIELLAENKRVDEALQLLGEAQARFPENRSMVALEVHLLNQAKRFEEAFKVLDKADATWPDDSDFAYNRGMTQDASGNKAKALELMEDLLIKEPENYQALNYIGYSLAEAGQDLDRALVLLRKANELAPQSPHILDSLAWAYFRKGQFEPAWTHIREAVKIDPYVDPTIWEHYGDIAKALGHGKEAVKAYKKALELAPENAKSIEERLRALPSGKKK